MKTTILLSLTGALYWLYIAFLARSLRHATEDL
jgi:hypothetical protein